MSGAVVVMHQNRLMRRFQEAEATSPNAAKTPVEVGCRNSWTFHRMAARGVFIETDDGLQNRLEANPIIMAMNDGSTKIVKKIQTLAQIAADLRTGKNHNITRLTMLKSLCSDPEAAAAFALYVAKKMQQALKHPGRPPSETMQRHQRLVRKAVRRMTSHVKKPTDETESSLEDLLSEIRNVQNQYERQRWGPVRIIVSGELLVVETALDCVLRPWASSDLGYHLARLYAERYNPRYGTGLIPESAPMVEDIAEFWGQHFLGRSWRKRLMK